jgi:hypothetical protein
MEDSSLKSPLDGMAALNLNEARHRHAAVKQYPNPANFEELRMLAFSPPPLPASSMRTGSSKPMSSFSRQPLYGTPPTNHRPAPYPLRASRSRERRSSIIFRHDCRLWPLVCVLSGGAKKRTSGKRTKEGPSGHIKRRRRSPLGPPKPVSAPRSLPPRSRRLVPRPRGMVPRPRRLSLRPRRL